MPAMNLNAEPHYFSRARLTISTVQSVDEAAIAWRAGDVYRAWSLIGEVCHAPWVAEVLESLRMSGSGRGASVIIAEELQRGDRSRLIRSRIENRVSKDSPSDSSSGKIPPLSTSLKSLKSFIAQAPEDSAISWLRDSARHAVEHDQSGSLDRPLRVALLGEFSSGKSRLINALLGQEILSTGIVPVTRTVTRIVHAPKITMTVRYVNGNEKVISPEQLRAYTDERKVEVDDPEVEEVVLGHPLKMLKMVELWDTPGFNSTNQLHDQVAAQLLLEADAVLWILTPHQVGSQSESQLLKMVRCAQGKVLGVLNQCDRINGEEIEHQVSEVKKHYGEMVEEVVTTSAKWLEEKIPGGNLEQLMSHISNIGSWSQQLRKRKVARRVAAVDAQAKAYLDLLDEEAKQIEKKHQQFVKKLNFDRKNALAEWKEAVEHHEQISGMRRDGEDYWFNNDCSKRLPLTVAYRSLSRKELSLEGYEALIPCLRTLEEVHWLVSPGCPAPWREDFLLGWRRGLQRDDSQQAGNLFHLDEVTNSSTAFWLQKMAYTEEDKFPSRWTGFGFKKDRRIIQKVFRDLSDIPSSAEIVKWWAEIGQGLLDEDNSSLSNLWSANLARVIDAAPARKYQPWLHLEKKVSELVEVHRKPIQELKKEKLKFSILGMERSKEESRLTDQRRRELKAHEDKPIIKKVISLESAIDELVLKIKDLHDPTISTVEKARRMLEGRGGHVPADNSMMEIIKAPPIGVSECVLRMFLPGVVLFGFISALVEERNLPSSFYSLYVAVWLLGLVGLLIWERGKLQKLDSYLKTADPYLEEYLNSYREELAQACDLKVQWRIDRRRLLTRSTGIKSTKAHRDFIKSENRIERLKKEVQSARKSFVDEIKLMSKHIPQGF